MNTRMERLIPDDEYGNEPATTQTRAPSSKI
jgi:hypothetical protein